MATKKTKAEPSYAEQITTAYNTKLHVPGIDPKKINVYVTVIVKGGGPLPEDVRAIAMRELPQKPRTLPALASEKPAAKVAAKPASKPARAKKTATKASAPTAKRKAAKRS